MSGAEMFLEEASAEQSNLTIEGRMIQAIVGVGLAILELKKVLEEKK